MKELIIHNFIYFKNNPLLSINKTGFLDKISKMGIETILKDEITIEIFDDFRDPGTNILGLKSWKELSYTIINHLNTANFESEFHFMIGGDCSNLLGIIGYFKLQNKDINLICFDAHTDYLLPKDSLTGEPADSEIAIITGNGPEDITNFLGVSPLIKEENVLLLGIRQFDQINKSKIKYYSPKEIRCSTNRLFSNLNSNFPVWLHLDVDVFDPEIMPVNYPLLDGLSFKEFLEIMEIMLETYEIIGLSVGCYHPELDKTGKATKDLAEILIKLIEKILIKI